MKRHVVMTKHSLGDEDDQADDQHATLTPAERVALVWELTRSAMAFRERTHVESRLQRSTVRLRPLRG